MSACALRVKERQKQWSRVEVIHKDITPHETKEGLGNGGNRNREPPAEKRIDDS